MAVGEKINLFCMPEYAYGEKGSGKIPPNATLRFEIELLAVAFPSITDDKAVRKESLLPGEGYRTPKEGARCVLSIAGKALKKDRSEVPFLPLERREVLDIDESELRPAGLFECAKSLKKGEKARFFIAPGKMHFAADELPPGVAPEDELVYEIEMVEFENVSLLILSFTFLEFFVF